MRYLDGFVIPVPRKQLKAYRSIARRAGRIWRDHGALAYLECVGEDLKTRFGLPFPRLTRLRPGEAVVFSWIPYRSRAHRDRVNAKVMKDPRMGRLMQQQKLPFDSKRMSYGGFVVIVDA